MKIFKIFIDIDKEEKYLNQMANKGYGLVKYNAFGIYTFKKIEPANLTYRVDYRLFKTKQQFQEYVELFKDSGWVHVYGKKNSANQYFLPSAYNKEDLSIFSDNESSAERYKTLEKLSLGSFSLTIIFFASSLQSLNNSVGFSLFDFRTWYYTPNLWQESGTIFLNKFLFETPFVVLRVGGLLFLLIMSIVYANWASGAKRLYKEKSGN